MNHTHTEGLWLSRDLGLHLMTNNNDRWTSAVIFVMRSRMSSHYNILYSRRGISTFLMEIM